MKNDDFKDFCKALAWAMAMALAIAIPASLVIYGVLVLVFVTL